MNNPATNLHPINGQEWQALARESKLVRQLIGSGVTALGKASYADGEGNYYVAFFGLSIGIERLAKLILVADHAINHSGTLPDQNKVRKYGHDLTKLLNKVESIATQHKLNLEYARPVDDISKAIIDCLDSFSNASKGRYANFEVLGNPNLGNQFEPVSKWWDGVGVKILKEHYAGKAVEKKVKRNAAVIDQLMGGNALVLHRNENGEIMQDMLSSSERTGQTKIVQKYGRFYTLQIVRWLSSVFIELSREGGYTHRIDTLFGHYEHFQTYALPDEFLKTRKIWPLT